MFCFQVFDVSQLPPTLIDGKKRFVCPYCSQPFSSRQNIKAHINSRHLGMKPVCSCGKEFTYKYDLDNHKKLTGH